MNSLEWLVILLVLIVCFVEIGLYLLVPHLRKGYQWLITAKDECPVFDATVLNKFIRHGYDPILGWVRKPDTSGKENGRYGETTYTINSRGSRTNPGYEDLPAYISCYGDSFTFCRQVNDNETWEYYLAKLIKRNVLNFGVGNYGMDQAVIRLKREFPGNYTKLVILGVVPETISRVLNIWKHYHEYGNIYGFKPRYYLNNGKLHYIKQLIDNKDKFFHLENYLGFLRKNDYFYNTKFSKDILRFPYLFSLVKSYRRNIPLITRLLFKQIFDAIGIYPAYKEHLHNISVLRRNIRMCAELYQKQEIVSLMIAILNEFVSFCNRYNALPIFLFLPQFFDIARLIF